MKKKLLAVVLSVVMIAALLVPMMAISAADVPTATIGLGTAKLMTINNADYIAVTVEISNNAGAFYTGRYQVISKEGLTPFNFQKGDFVGEYKDPFGSSLPVTLNITCKPETFPDRLQVVHDAASDSGTEGILTAAGCLGTAYFIAPTAVGTYTFEIVWMDGTDNTKAQYEMAVEPATVTYTVECKTHEAQDAPILTKPADCENAGEEVTYCKHCGAEMSKKTIPALGHEWDNGVVAEGVKCGETADTTFTCEREGCGKTRVETGAVVEHDMVADEANSKAATCEEDGVEAKKCAREGCTHTETKTLPKLGHTMVADQGAGKAPTCTEDGKVVEKCTNAGCDHVEETPITKLGHDFSGEFTLVTAPTADAEGAYTIGCIRCEEVEEYIAKKLDTSVEYELDGEVILSFKADEAILPEDVIFYPQPPVKDEETGKITEVFTFGSLLVEDLAGEVEVAINTLGEVTNIVVTTKDAEGNVVDVESAIVDGMLVFNADLAGEYTITYEEIKTSPDTDDAANTVVFAVVAFIALAGLVVVGKKRFAL